MGKWIEGEERLGKVRESHKNLMEHHGRTWNNPGFPRKENLGRFWKDSCGKMETHRMSSFLVVCDYDAQ